jgi:acetyl/propionyl-CoA carboxylase alpha subunit
LEGLESSKRESLKSFKDDRVKNIKDYKVLIEKYIEIPRHIEV